MQEFELYGFSLFETFLAKEGCFWRLEEHWNRLATSARHFAMDVPDLDRFRQEVSAYHDATRSEVLRYTLIQTGGRWSSTSLATQTRILKKTWKPLDPCPIRLHQEERPLPVRDEMRCHKTGSRMLYQAAYHRARSRGYDDCVFSDADGYILESSTHNLCFRLDGNWYTPPMSRGILPGVMRAYLIAEHGVTERDIRNADLDRCEAVVASNSVRGLMPISALGHRMLATNEAETFIASVGTRDYT